ncbi:hypothetical protein EVAR_90392_1 [Eumeta japonica]|uniref:Uncharacterized protein n=1 Tax=Eumeta variegata TaxID=151549 RepID=A0A4C1ZRR3_EUMVA|nr:hypothetical protein EVAR_90392_1 [Eumeta japonica]
MEISSLILVVVIGMSLRNVSKASKASMDALTLRRTCGKVSQFRETDEVRFWERWLAQAALQRPRSTLTSARPRVNQDEQAAELRSILQSKEEVTDCD